MYQDLARIFGSGNVLDDPHILESYSRDESFVQPTKPQFVVKAQSSAQIQELVQWANWTLVPLVPVSSGPPHFRGDTVPSAPGAIAVDLSGMRKIIHVDARNRMVMIEPGVTYAQLQPELAKHGLSVSSPLAPRANKSVVAALLEREPLTVPRFQWNLLDPLRCTEVIWGDGQRMATGEAETYGVSLQEEWANHLAQVVPAGPAQTNFYKFTSAAQGSMGIVTWASVKCAVLPRIHEFFFVPSSRIEDLLDFTYAILRFRFADEIMIMNNWNFSMLLGKTADQIRDLASQLPKWTLIIGIAGRDRLPEERVAYQEKDISDMAHRHSLQLLPAAPGVNGSGVASAVLNPSGEPFWKLAYKGACQELFFLSTLDKTPQFIETMQSLNGSQDIGVYLQPVQQGASCHIEFNLPFDRTNPAEAESTKQLYVQASRLFLTKGAYFSRPYAIWSSLAFSRDEQSATVLRKIKQIFDPNNVMNPGKLCF